MGKLVTRITDETGREVTLLEQLKAAEAAWESAEEAIREAWRLTPIELCSQRTSVPRNFYDQNIAQRAASAMRLKMNRAVGKVVRSQGARDSGQPWAAPTDHDAMLEAVAS